MPESFAPPASKLVESGIGVAAAPTGGMGLALDEKGKLPLSVLPFQGQLVTLICSAPLTLTTAFQDVAGCSADLVPGTYLILGVFDFAHTVNGAGVAVGVLTIAGTDQAQQALLGNTGAANGDRATVSNVWIVTVSSTVTAKLRAKKTINAGTASANTNGTLSYARLG